MNESPTQVYHEIHAVIKRYSAEGDVTIFALIGVLEAVKADLMDFLEDFNHSNP